MHCYIAHSQLILLVWKLYKLKQTHSAQKQQLLLVWFKHRKVFEKLRLNVCNIL